MTPQGGPAAALAAAPSLSPRASPLRLSLVIRVVDVVLTHQEGHLDAPLSICSLVAHT